MAIRALTSLAILVLAVGSARAAASVQIPERDVCTNEVMTAAATGDKSCPKALYSRKPTDGCCESLANYYGPNSTLPSANCFCNKDYWTWLLNLSDSGVRWTKHLDGCRKKGFEIYYYTKKDGPCSGEAWPAAAVEAEDETAPLPKRSFGAWVRGLKEDTWGAILFVVGLISVIGFALMSWPFVFALLLDAFGLARKLRSGKMN